MFTVHVKDHSCSWKDLLCVDSTCLVATVCIKTLTPTVLALATPGHNCQRNICANKATTWAFAFISYTFNIPTLRNYIPMLRNIEQGDFFKFTRNVLLWLRHQLLKMLVQRFVKQGLQLFSKFQLFSKLQLFTKLKLMKTMKSTSSAPQSASSGEKWSLSESKLETRYIVFLLNISILILYIILYFIYVKIKYQKSQGPSDL